MNMIEKVAAAIKADAEKQAGFQYSFRMFAKAAIEAMKEPTDEMLEILERNDGTAYEYQCAIEAALKIPDPEKN